VENNSGSYDRPCQGPSARLINARDALIAALTGLPFKMVRWKVFYILPFSRILAFLPLKPLR
jgi:hypothetical protein